jgi:hypothetical protein
MILPISASQIARISHEPLQFGYFLKRKFPCMFIKETDLSFSFVMSYLDYASV